MMASLLRRLLRLKNDLSRGRSRDSGKRSKTGTNGPTARPHQVVPTNSTSSPIIVEGSSKSLSVANNSNRGSKSKGTTVRARRLMKEYKEICKFIDACQRNALEAQDRENGPRDENPLPFTVELVEDSLFEWRIKVFHFDVDSHISRDMKEMGYECILFNAKFPETFPFEPPFIRVVSPHIEKGFVMEGGALCLELLTPSGWASAYTMEAVIMQVMASFVKGQARIRPTGKEGSAATKKFSKKLAEASFKSLVRTHQKYGWVNPPLTEG